MEEKVISSPRLEARQQVNHQAPSRPSSRYSRCKNSCEITKPRPGAPKIRIIHQFTPVVIKTDVSNFRELVQRLTGKEAKSSKNHGAKARRQLVAVKGAKPDVASKFADDNKPEVLVEQQEEEEEMKKDGDEIDPHGLITGLEDIDGFIQSLIQFPQIPLDHRSLQLI